MNTIETRTRNILPCPFCGGKENVDVFFGNISSHGHPPKYSIRCVPCDATMFDDRPDKVIGNWNARASAMNGSAGVWVKVSERVPDHKEQVLCYGLLAIKDLEPKVYKVRYYQGDEFNKTEWVHGPVSVRRVTHWMPLPSPPDESVSSPSPQPLATSYQKCPKCDGQGSVSKPPWLSGDIHQWSSTAATFVCDVCNGAKIIPTPFSPSPLEAETADKKACCNQCGGAMIFIRGKYPKDDRRLACPTCAVERLERINEIASSNINTVKEGSPKTANPL